MEEVFTDVEIDEFHDLCGLFMDAWVQLNGYEHVTNYIHYNWQWAFSVQPSKIWEPVLGTVTKGGKLSTRRLNAIT